MFLKISQIKIPIHRVDVFLFDADIAKGDLGWRVVKNLLPQQRISNFAVPLFSKSPVTFSQYRCQFILNMSNLRYFMSKSLTHNSQTCDTLCQNPWYSVTSTIGFLHKKRTHQSGFFLLAGERLELSTSRVWAVRSSQLSYPAI